MERFKIITTNKANKHDIIFTNDYNIVLQISEQLKSQGERVSVFELGKGGKYSKLINIINRINIIDSIQATLEKAYNASNTSDEQNELINYIYFKLVKVINNLLDDINEHINNNMLDNNIINY